MWEFHIFSLQKPRHLLQHTLLDTVIIMIYDGLLHPRSKCYTDVRVYVENIKIKCCESRESLSIPGLCHWNPVSGHLNTITFTFSYQVSNADHMRCCDSYDASYTRVKRLYEPSKSTCDTTGYAIKIIVWRGRMSEINHCLWNITSDNLWNTQPLFMKRAIYMMG